MLAQFRELHFRLKYRHQTKSTFLKIVLCVARSRRCTFDRQARAREDLIAYLSVFRFRWLRRTRRRLNSLTAGTRCSRAVTKRRTGGVRDILVNAVKQRQSVYPSRVTSKNLSAGAEQVRLRYTSCLSSGTCPDYPTKEHWVEVASTRLEHAPEHTTPRPTSNPFEILNIFSE